MNQRLETTLKLLPYTTVFIIICGIIKSMIFFSFFDISILSFLDFDECLFLFLEIFIFAFVFTFITAIIMAKTPKRTREDNIKWILLYVFGAILFVIFLFIRKFDENSIVWINYFMIIGFSWFLPSFLNWITQRILGNANYLLNFWTTLIMCQSILILFSAISFGALHGYKTKKNAYKKQVSITLDSEKIIQTSDTLIFVDRTKNFTFFYNPITEMNRIILNSQIKEIRIK